MYECSEQAVEERMRELDTASEPPTLASSRREEEARKAFLDINRPRCEGYLPQEAGELRYRSGMIHEPVHNPDALVSEFKRRFSPFTIVTDPPTTRSYHRKKPENCAADAENDGHSKAVLPAVTSREGA